MVLDHHHQGMGEFVGSRYLVAATLLLLLGCTEKHQTPPPPPPNASEPRSTTAPVPTASKSIEPLAAPQYRKYCHSGFPLEGVYSPQRLTVKNPCVAVTGTASDIGREHDGDMHISLTGVDRRWLNSVNLKRLRHDLVVEAVPDIPITTPPANSRITVIGPWVLDTQTGWLEIHPVWAILPAG
jgi:hypothetical protein